MLPYGRGSGDVQQAVATARGGWSHVASRSMDDRPDMDPITEELFRNAVAALGDEMVLTIYRTAYSGVLKNIMDYSAAICDAEGRLVAQGLSLPGHLASIPVALRAALRHYGSDI